MSAKIVVIGAEKHIINEDTSIFLNFDLKLENNSNTPIQFRFDSIRIKYNGVISKEVYYRSIASILAMTDTITNTKDYSLYAIFPGSTDAKSLKSFEVLNFGIIK